MIPTTRIMLLALTTLLVATCTFAEIQPITQSRLVTCSAYAEDDSSYDSDSDVGRARS